MTSGQKIAFSLLTTIILVAGFVFTAQSTNLFKILDDRYYSQTVVKEKNEHLNSIAQSLDSYISNVLIKLDEGDSAYVKEASVRSYMDQNPTEAQLENRRNLTTQLFNDIPSLAGIRLVDKNGKSLHYSSYEFDVLKTNGSYKTYKNYTEVVKDSNEIDFTEIKVNESAPVRRILLDSKKNRIILALPFNWIGDVYSGTMFFYLNFKDIEQELINSKVISYGENVKLISDGYDGGILINLPNVSQDEFYEPVITQWRNSKSVSDPEKLLEMKDGRFWLLLSEKSDNFGAVAGVYTSDTFQLPQELIYAIYGCVAITIFLLAFLLFSFKRSSETVIKKRLKKIQYGIIKEYLDNKEKIEWSTVVKQLKSRKSDLTGDIYSSLGVHSKKQKKHLDEFLEKSWSEIFEVLEGTKVAEGSNATASSEVQSGGLNGITREQLRSLFEEVLQETSLNVKVSNVVASGAVPVSKVSAVEDVEEVEDLEDVEDLDDVEEVEDLDDVEEIEDAEEVEELDDVEEVEDAEEVEELDDVEEIEDAEEVEEIEDAEEVEDAEPVMEVFPPSSGANTPKDTIERLAESVVPAETDADLQCFDTFIRNELLPNTISVFAEELHLGPEYVLFKKEYTPITFNVYELPGLTPVKVQQAEEKKETPVQSKPRRSGLLAAAEAIAKGMDIKNINVSTEVKTSDSNAIPKIGGDNEPVLEDNSGLGSIVESNGIYQIASDLEYNDVDVDKSFQSLVDSVLK